VEWSGWVWGRELEEEPILAEEIITCFKLWSWGRKPCIITCWEESHKSSGGWGWGGVELLGEHHHLQEEIHKSSGRWSLESIIACWKLKSIKALGGSLESIITCRKKSKTPTKPTRRTMTTTTTAAALTNPSKTNLIL